MSDLDSHIASVVTAAYGLLGALVGAVEGVVHGLNGDYMVEQAFQDATSYKTYSKIIRPLPMSARQKVRKRSNSSVILMTIIVSLQKARSKKCFHLTTKVM